MIIKEDKNKKQQLTVAYIKRSGVIIIEILFSNKVFKTFPGPHSESGFSYS